MLSASQTLLRFSVLCYNIQRAQKTKVTVYKEHDFTSVPICDLSVVNFILESYLGGSFLGPVSV